MIHVVKDRYEAMPNVTRFTATVRRLNGREAFRQIKKMEAPQNYHLHIHEYLFKEGIIPLELQDRRMGTDGRTLKDHIDFLGQSSYSDGIDHGPVIDDD